MRLPLRSGTITLRRSDAVFVLGAAAALCLIGAASPALESAHAPRKLAPAPKAFVDASGPPLECAIYARTRSGVELYGAARTWWAQAEGKYARARVPTVGAVMVMGGTEGGHVAVVAHVLNARQIIVDHANWLGRGEIVTGALVEDASAGGDWSAVRVWNVEARTLGGRAYPVLGFVLAEEV